MPPRSSSQLQRQPQWMPQVCAAYPTDHTCLRCDVVTQLAAGGDCEAGCTWAGCDARSIWGAKHLTEVECMHPCRLGLVKHSPCHIESLCPSQRQQHVNAPSLPACLFRLMVN